MIVNPLLVLTKPQILWNSLANAESRDLKLFLPYLLFICLVPCASWIYGTTEVGWRIGDGDTIKLTMDSAVLIAVCFYVSTLLAIGAIGYSVHWMAETYGTKSSFMKGIALVSLTATPFFIVSLSGFYPVFWVNLGLSIVGVCWSTWLLYTSVPKVMNIPEDRGFLFASALLAVALVIFLVILGATAILWDMGYIPVFAD